MDQIQDVLTVVRDKKLAKGRLRGVFHVAIGRTITRADGTAVSAGVTWRQLADLLRELRFDTDLVREIGADPDTLSPRDRQKFWYAAIGAAKVDSAAAYTEAEKLAAALKPLGYIVGPPPSMATAVRFPAVIPTPLEPVEERPATKKPSRKQK